MTYEEPQGDSAVIDMHTHAISLETPDLEHRFPFGAWPTVVAGSNGDAEILVGGRHFRNIDSRCWSGRRRLADMDSEGVELQVVSPVPVTFCYNAPLPGALELCRFQNEFFASLCQERPQRFRALGAVPLQDIDAAIQELEYCVRSLGFLGVEVGSYVAGRDLADPGIEPFLAAAEELSALVFVHPGELPSADRLTSESLRFGVGMPCETATAAAKLLLSGVFDKWPNLRMCLAHAGGALPSILPRLEQGWRLFADGTRSGLSPIEAARHFLCDSLAYDSPSLHLAIERFGIGSVMVGSDYPFAARETPPGATVAAARSVRPQQLELIRKGNAARLFVSLAESGTADGASLHSGGQR